MNGRTTILGTCVLAIAAHAAFARPFDQTPVTVEFKQDGTVEARIAFNVNAMLADAPFRDLSDADYDRIRNMAPEDRAQRMEEIADYLGQRIRLKFDGKMIDIKILFPELDEQSVDDGPVLPGDYFVACGNVPTDAKAFTFTASPMFFNVYLLIRAEGEDSGIRHVLPPGQETDPFREFPTAENENGSVQNTSGDQDG